MSDTFNRAVRLWFPVTYEELNPLEHPLEWDDAYEFEADWSYPE